MAKILGVGTTSVKRWADSGLLRCVKTPGGHRRFPRDAVEEFMARNRHKASAPPDPPVLEQRDVLIRDLTTGVPAEKIIRELELRRREQGS
ncbi:MAG: helix-turn-helix domain-containing protein, partial [Myxococcota bacterium]